MSRPTHDILATVGEYTDRHTGQKKKSYAKCGVAFTDDNGRLSLKLDTVPVAPNWSGWLQLFPIDRQQGHVPAADTASPRDERGQRPAPQPADDCQEEDDIPF